MPYSFVLAQGDLEGNTMPLTMHNFEQRHHAYCLRIRFKTARYLFSTCSPRIHDLDQFLSSAHSQRICQSGYSIRNLTQAGKSSPPKPTNFPLQQSWLQPIPSPAVSRLQAHLKSPPMEPVPQHLPLPRIVRGTIQVLLLETPKLLLCVLRPSRPQPQCPN